MDWIRLTLQLSNGMQCAGVLCLQTENSVAVCKVPNGGS